MIHKTIGRTATALALSLGLAACGTFQSRTAEFTQKGEKLSIHAVGNVGNVSTEITVFVNGQAVATGSTNLVKPVVNMTGMYKRIKIDAECKTVAVGSIARRECSVYADSQKAADLSF